MGIEILKENNGEQLIEYKLPNFINENGNKFSNNSDDYEILQVLGEGGFANVLKVKSKTNFGIYAMKKVDMSYIENVEKLSSKYYDNEILFLKTLNHPNIIKCYNVFKEDQYLYFIMEFMNNGDLKSYNEGNKIMNKKIEEGKLWEIFYKCLSGLDYIHKKNLIHRDIKLQNIFLDENFNVKIGDFNASAVTNIEAAKNFSKEQENADQLVNKYTKIDSGKYKAPEVNRFGNPYGKKIDIYSMGVSFYELCYGHFPNEKKPKEDEGIMYSKELKDFIDKMIKKDPNERPNCNEIMIYAKNYFINHYVKNTSVEATLNCFNNFPNFNNFFSDNDNINNIFNLKIKISILCFSIIQSIKDNNISQFKNDLYELKELMVKEGSDIKNFEEEIDPGNFIILFIRKLNSELNEILSPNKNISEDEQIKRYKILSRKFSFSPYDVEKNFELLISTYNKKILSFISRNFFSYIKITRTCLICNNSSCSFDKLYFIPINIKILKQKTEFSNNISLKDAFNSLKNSFANIGIIKGIECKKCKKISEFKETKNFYHTAKNLIIIFDRGEKMKDEDFIDFDDSLYLNSNDVEKYTEIHYKLTGIITKLKEEYISLIRQNNIWISSKGDQFTFEDSKKFGSVIALFYYSEQNFLILESQKKKLQKNLQNEQNFINNDNNNIINNNYNNNVINNNNNIINNNYNNNVNNNNHNNQFQNQNQFMINNINNQQQQQYYFNQINNNPQNNNIPVNSFQEGNYNINIIPNNIGNNNNSFVRQNFNNIGNHQNNNYNCGQMNNNQFSNYNNNFNQFNNSNNNSHFNNLQPNNSSFNQINNIQNSGNQFSVGVPMNNFNNINCYNNNNLNWNNFNQNNIMNNSNNFGNPMGNSNDNYQDINNMRRFNNF